MKVRWHSSAMPEKWDSRHTNASAPSSGAHGFMLIQHIDE
jgi:hypothetical protein